MFKVSKFNPADTTLDEIHAIQEGHFRKRRNWTFEQLQAHYQQIVRKISNEMGFKIRTAEQKVK